jgi:cytochrome c-type protein NapB
MCCQNRKGLRHIEDMKRFFIIFLFVILTATTIVIWSYSYFSSHEEAHIVGAKISESSHIPSEKGVFDRSSFALEYSIMPLDPDHQRNLKTYYDNRAFYGAPPSIPHPVFEGSIGANECLKCHENGGFVEKFNAYTPVSPHPDKLNCVQCHVQVKTDQLFSPSSFKSNSGPSLKNQALLGSPPIIPHQIQLRENCLSCHAGSSAVKEIRTSHPNRINCRQCHVINEKKLADIGIFKRDIKQ